MTKLVADGASDGATQAYPWLCSRVADKSSSRKLRELEDMKRAGAVRPGSLLSGDADGFGVAPPPLSQRSARTDAGPSLCFLSRSFTLQPISRTWSYATAVASISIRMSG